MGQGGPLQACVFSIARVKSVSGSAVATQARTVMHLPHNGCKRNLKWCHELAYMLLYSVMGVCMASQSACWPSLFPGCKCSISARVWRTHFTHLTRLPR